VDIKAQFNPVYGKLHHVGVVVKDMDKAIAYYESLGIGPFQIREGVRTITIPFKGELHGKPAEWTTKISNANLGGVELELLEPVEGPQALKESLDATGEGLHHIGFLATDVDAEMKKWTQKGLKVWTSSRRDNKTAFCYFEPVEIGKVSVELRLP
jgi:methylmalonyl-CoA/ethylmalonyl-CoA epimerase